jgi:hypothetical protein
MALSLPSNAEERARKMDNGYFAAIIQEALQNLEPEKLKRIAVVSSPYLSDQIAVFRVFGENGHFLHLEPSDYRSDSILDVVRSAARNEILIPMSQYEYQE